MATNARPAAIENFERQIIKQGEAVLGEWKHYLDAPGAPAIESETDRYVMAKMLDTANAQLKTMEATQTTSVFGTNYLKALLGMTRQVFPRLFGTELVSVQPMDRPTGQIFHLSITRDDGTSRGIRPQDDASGINSTSLVAANDYATHGTSHAGADVEGQAIAKSMKLGITSSSVEIGVAKKLQTEATMELVQDLQAYHNLNALDLLQGAAVDEIAQEIDGMLVSAVRAAALAAGTVTFGHAPTGWTAKDWAPRIQRAILEADKRIFARSLRRPNVMVVGMDAYLELQDLNGFKLSADLEGVGNYGLQPVGSLNSQYKVFVSRYVADNEIILGRKGSGFLDAGVVYAPYIPLFVSDRFFDVKLQKTTQSYASRFGIFTIANTVYGRVLIDDAQEGIVLPS